MSEIQDAAQIIKVSFEGAEIILKMGNTGWQFVKDICAVFKKVLRRDFCVPVCRMERGVEPVGG